MSYQPPGPYPVFPQYPGGAEMPPRPPLPATVLRAHYCILAGAVLTVASAVATVASSSSVKTSVSDGFGNAVIATACFTAAIEVGLWIWMAYATKAGKHWARILSTVFFGFEATGQIIGTLAVHLISSRTGDPTTTDVGSQSVAGQIFGWLTFGVGLAAIILLWNKASGPYFKPLMPYPVPYGYPGYPGGPGGPMPPYPYPVMPPQSPQQPQQGGAPQQPGDPWSTTPKD